MKILRARASCPPQQGIAHWTTWRAGCPRSHFQRGGLDPWTPVPLSATLCGLLGSLSLIDRVAERSPARVGLKVKLIVHFPLLANLSPAAQVELD
jgi:hypothetical protein